MRRARLWCVKQALFNNYRLLNWISGIEIQAGIPRLVLKFEKEMKMAVFEQWEEAWNKNDAAAWIALLHEDYQFKFHSNGKVMKNLIWRLRWWLRPWQMRALQTGAVYMRMMISAWSTNSMTLKMAIKKPLCWWRWKKMGCFGAPKQVPHPLNKTLWHGSDETAASWI